MKPSDTTIVFIIGQLTHGGSEKQLYLLATLLKKRKYNIFVIVLSNLSEPYGRLLKNKGISVFTIRKIIPFFDIFRIVRLSRIIRKAKANIIHSFSLTANFYTFWSTVFMDSVVFAGGSRNVELNRSKFFKKIDDFIFRYANALIVNSEENLKVIKKNSKKPGQVNGFVIKNGIDIPLYKKKIDSIKNELNIGIVALFKKQKNYRLFVDLSEKICNLFENVHFFAVGSGPEYSRIVTYATKKQCSAKIHFLEEREDILELMLSQFDIFVLTSSWEGLPNVIMEAMSIGLPVIATNVGGVSELVIHNKTGFLVPSGDLNSLVYYCSLLIEDTNLRRKMGEEGRKFILNNFSIIKMVEEYETLFDKLLV